MDTSDPDIVFNDAGVCNHCLRYESLKSHRIVPSAERESKLRELVAQIKSRGQGNEYDCIIGVSGGVDSTYVAYLAKSLGLRPLAIHFDNGWNSELAVANIENTLKTLDIDLITYVIDWEIFRDLQIAFLKSSTPDGEIPTDHAINALLFQEAAKRGIRTIINGMNFATESMAVKSWAYGHSDWTYIKDVQRRYGTRKLTGFPHFSLFALAYYVFIRRIKVVSILNYVDYNKEKVMELIQTQLGWRYYGGKHYESVYTRFFQSYVLVRKFGIDKRRGHLSDLINSGQLTRDSALKEIETPVCDPSLQQEDLAFVSKKFGMSLAEFESVMQLPPQTFRSFKNQDRLIQKIKNTVNHLRKIGLYPR